MRAVAQPAKLAWSGAPGRRLARLARLGRPLSGRPATTTPAAAAPPNSSLAHLPQDIRPDVARALELAERVSWGFTHTDFLTPPAVTAALTALQGRADVAARPWGGWAGAERCRLILGQPDRLADVLGGGGEGGDDGDDDSASPPSFLPEDVGGVAALTLRGRFTFEAATHRDFLGAILRGAGLDRRVIGDILLDGERGATVFVAPGVVPAIESGVTGVRGVTVVATRVSDLASLRLPEPRPPLPIKSTEASLRLDAVASTGFRASRSKMAEDIRKGAVKLNYVSTTKGSAPVAAGDVISCAGKGRVVVVSVTATRKGRWSIDMVRYA